MTWIAGSPEGNESGKIRHKIVPYTSGKGLDIGCGPWKAWPHFISIDAKEEWVNLDWSPDIKMDGTLLDIFAAGSMDFVYSSHFLEHVEDTEATLREWWRVIKPGGYLVLYLPHKGFYPNIGEPGHNPEHKHDFLPEDIVRVMERVGSWDLVENEDRNERDEYSFFQVYKKLKGKKREYSYSKKPTKPTCLVIRYGGFGDMIQASSILPYLREKYHIVFQCTPKGQDILKHNPYIDEFCPQGDNQVPNEQLGDYWKALGDEYDKIINLSESVEGTLLALPGRRDHAMTKAARHATKNLNYLEFTHMLADVPQKYHAVFHPSKIEDAAAGDYRKKMGDVPVILWTLAGSSVNKTWPWTEQVVLRLLAETNVKIVFCGDKLCRMLEMGITQTVIQSIFGTPYEETNETKLSVLLFKLKKYFGANRLICKSGNWSIRDTLSFVPYADVLVGPETGVMNAGGLLDVPKVVMLSHSTQENLTKHWHNTTVIEPDVDCYPCHRLHYTREFCPHDEETGAALCAASIKPDTVFQAIKEVLDR